MPVFQRWKSEASGILLRKDGVNADRVREKFWRHLYDAEIHYHNGLPVRERLKKLRPSP